MADCRCGCGNVVALRYLPGHDRRHTARLVREVRQGGTTVEQAHAEIGPFPLGGRFDRELADSRL